jgi:hypothetical protein
MDPFLNKRFAQGSPFTPSTPVSAPPPPSEVKVRTMRSDLASMAKSGGGLPRFENVKVAGLSTSARSAAQISAADAAAIPAEANLAPNPVAAQGRNNAILVLVVIIVLGALGALGYFAYRIYFTGSGTMANNTGSTGSANQGGNPAGLPSTAATFTPTPSATPTPIPPSQGPFTHVSLFAQTHPDQTLVLTLATPGAGATSSAALATFTQKLNTLLATAKPSDTMIEIDMRDASGNAVSVANVLDQANAQIFDPGFLEGNFSEDATFFVYHGSGGFWPGYILALQPGANVMAVQSGVSQLESSPNITNLFVNNPGAPSADGFTTSEVGSTTVRVLPFLNATPPAYFTYGWSSGNDLIVSTSIPGLQAALQDL